MVHQAGSCCHLGANNRPRKTGHFSKGMGRPSLNMSLMMEDLYLYCTGFERCPSVQYLSLYYEVSHHDFLELLDMNFT
jgi:hypothetical protein